MVPAPRGLACLTLGIWFGAAIFVDVTATRNFASVATFIISPPADQARGWIGTLGPASARHLLRLNAAALNAEMFRNWELVQLALGAVFLIAFALGIRPPKQVSWLLFGVLALVAAQRFLLTPRIAMLGPEVEFLPSTDPQIPIFWMFHGLYSGSEILKLILGAVAGFLLLRPEATKAT